MSGKPKKNKAPAAKEPIEDEFPVDDIEEQPVEVADIDEAPKRTYKGKAPADAKKKKKGRGFRLSSIDPIILASFSVFMIACLIVTGITIYDITAGETSTKPAEYGDSIELYYTGSLYAWYDEESAVIFDTDMKEVGEDNDKYKKSYSYTEKDSYSTLSITVGQGSWLDEFKNALIGHKPGDVVRIEIEYGYGELTEGIDKFTVDMSHSYTIDKVQYMTSSDYKTFFDVDEAPKAGFTTYDVETPYGWKANVTGITGDMVSIEHLATVKEYTVDGVTYNVTAVGATITFDYQMEDFEFGDNMLKGVYDNQIVYFIESDGTNMTYKSYKNPDENSKIPGELIGVKTMYFVIEFVGYTS